MSAQPIHVKKSLCISLYYQRNCHGYCNKSF